MWPCEALSLRVTPSTCSSPSRFLPPTRETCRLLSSDSPGLMPLNLLGFRLRLKLYMGSTFLHSWPGVSHSSLWKSGWPPGSGASLHPRRCSGDGTVLVPAGDSPGSPKPRGCRFTPCSCSKDLMHLLEKGKKRRHGTIFQSFRSDSNPRTNSLIYQPLLFTVIKVFSKFLKALMSS